MKNKIFTLLFLLNLNILTASPGEASAIFLLIAPGASAVATGGSTTGTATFTLNDTALADIKNNDAFIVALLESDHDFSNSEPGDINKTLAITFSETGGTSTDPKLSYTLQTGYSHDIMAVAAASIGKVNTVATANIGKISGT